METLRIPRGLWEDLQDTIAQQDQQFLTYVARELGLPVGEVLQKCGARSAERKPIPVLWAPLDMPMGEDCIYCPWWECHGDGLWRRCPRIRLSPALPCVVHERCTPCPRMACINANEMRKVVPVRDHTGQLWWVDPDGRYPPFREDGTLDRTRMFRKVRDTDGELVWASFKLAPKQTESAEDEAA